MWFLASGEGPSDIGRCEQTDPCSGEDFVPGPMAWLADQVIEDRYEFSAIFEGRMSVLSKQALKRRAKTLRPPRLRGRKAPVETAYYFRNARALAQHAQALEAEQGQDVVAILFRFASDWNTYWIRRSPAYDQVDAQAAVADTLRRGAP